MSNTDKIGRTVVGFAAIDQYVEGSIPQPVERQASGADWIRWGKNNRYPDYLLSLYDRSATLRSVVDGTVDYIAGDDVFIDNQADVQVNRYGDTPRDLVKALARDLKITGGFAIQIIRSASGQVAELYALEMRFVRANREADVFYYSEKWGKSNPAPETYPAFRTDVTEKWGTLTPDERERNISSVLYVRPSRSTTYPTPCYLASIPSCEIEANIDTYHLNALNNGFAPSAVINMLNGQPNDEDKAEIERMVDEKLGGVVNGARIMLNFADDKDHAATVETFKVEDFGERYQALERSSKQKIFTAFRAHPVLFGIPTQTDSLNLSSDNYQDVFRLFNRTQIVPAQRSITDAIARIYGRPAMTIKPFTLDGTDTQTIS